MDGLEVFKGDDGLHYWHVKEPQSDKIVATGGEGYSSRGNAIRGFASAQRVIVAGSAKAAAMETGRLAATADEAAKTS